MKIIKDNCVYVQKNDIAYLNQCDLPIPASILLKLVEKGIAIIDDHNRYEFIKYEKEDEIEFFRNLDWIIDYDEVKDLERPQILELAEEINDERNATASKYNSMDEEERQRNYSLVSRCGLLEYKFYSLRDFLWFKEGHIKMTLPENTPYPKGVKEKKGIKRLLKSLKDKK